MHIQLKPIETAKNVLQHNIPYNMFFEGFRPTKKFLHSAKERFWSVLRMAPSDANLFIEVKKVRNGFVGALKVTSSCGQFFVEAVSKDPYKLSTVLQEKIQEELSLWKSKRSFEYGGAVA